MSIFPEQIIQQVLDALDPIKVLELINYKTDTIQKREDTVKCFCPIHKEVVFRTLIINLKDNTFKCSYSLCGGNKGGDLITLYALSTGIDYDQAITRLVNELELNIELPTTQEFIDKNIEVAENYLELSIYDEAERNFQKVLEIQPENLSARRGLIDVYTETNETEKLQEQFASLVSALIANKEFDECIKYCNQVLEKDPNNLETRENLIAAYRGKNDMESFVGEVMNLADIYIEQGQYDDALRMYQMIDEQKVEIIDVQPHIIQVLVALGRTEEAVERTLTHGTQLLNDGDIEGAMVTYRQVIELDDSRDDIRQEYINLALQLELTENRIVVCSKIADELASRGMLTEAADSLEKIKEKVPRNIFNLEKLIEIYRQQGRQDKVIETQQHLIACLFERREYTRARQTLDAILEDKPEVAEFYVLLAKIEKAENHREATVKAYQKAIEHYRNQNQLEHALQTYDLLIECEPENIDIRDAQVQMYIEAGKKEEAFAKCEELIKLLEDSHKQELLIEKIKFALHLVPSSTDLWLKLAEIEHSNGNIEAAKNAYFELHSIYLEQKNQNNALSQLQKILDLDPDDVRALRSMAEIQHNVGDDVLALKYYKRVADILFDKKELNASEDIYQQVLSIAPDDLSSLNKLAQIYESLERKEDLLKAWQKLIELYEKREAYGKVIDICQRMITEDPDDVFALSRMASAYEETEQLDLAIQSYFRLSEIYYILDEHDQQRKTLDRILTLQPENDKARQEIISLLIELKQNDDALAQTNILVDQYRNQKNYDSAIKFLNSLLEKEPENLSYHFILLTILEEAGKSKQFVAQAVLLIDLLRARDKLDEVVEWYKKILTHEPDNINFRLNLIEALRSLDRIVETIKEYNDLAVWYEQHENIEDATETYKKILELAPENESPHRALINIYKTIPDYELTTKQINTLADIQRKQGKADQAIDTLQMVFEYDAEDIPTHRAIIEIAREKGDTKYVLNEYQKIYDIYFEKEEFEKAVEVQREAIELYPMDPGLREPLIMALISARRMKEAVEELFKLAGIYGDKQEYDRVLQVCSQIIEHDPNNLKARRLRAQTFLNLGDEKKALAEFMQISVLMDDMALPLSTDGDGTRRKESATTPRLAVMKEYTFDSFVVGEHNHFAYATAMSVARAPAKNYNPLFIFADVGLGKTHLLHAIANYESQQMPENSVIYTNAEEFTTELVSAIQNNRINEFRHRYSTLDILLLDDVHFLAGKQRAQEEFFHIFNALFQAKKQIVVTSDRPPKDIPHLEKRLKSRFGAGVIIDIQPPEFETRVAILKKEIDSHPEVGISDNIVSLIAERIEWNVRELKGALNQVLALIEIGNEEVSEEKVRNLLDSLFEKV